MALVNRGWTRDGVLPMHGLGLRQAEVIISIPVGGVGVKRRRRLRDIFPILDKQPIDDEDAIVIIMNEDDF